YPLIEFCRIDVVGQDRRTPSRLLISMEESSRHDVETILHPDRPTRPEIDVFVFANGHCAIAMCPGRVVRDMTADDDIGFTMRVRTHRLIPRREEALPDDIPAQRRPAGEMKVLEGIE